MSGIKDYGGPAPAGSPSFLDVPVYRMPQYTYARLAISKNLGFSFRLDDDTGYGGNQVLTIIGRDGWVDLRDGLMMVGFEIEKLLHDVATAEAADYKEKLCAKMLPTPPDDPGR